MESDNDAWTKIALPNKHTSYHFIEREKTKPVEQKRNEYTQCIWYFNNNKNEWNRKWLKCYTNAKNLLE